MSENAYTINRFCLFLFFLFMAIDQNQAQTPTSLIGKTYAAQIGSSCKAKSEGMCMIYTYCVMEFQESHVRVYYTTKASCTDKSMEAAYTHSSHLDYRVYTWELKNEQLIVKDFEEYAPFSFQKNQLTGTKKVNDKTETLEFQEAFE